MDLLHAIDEGVIDIRQIEAHEPWPTDEPGLYTVGETPKSVAPVLAEHYFELGWLPSYREGNTIVNARRPNGFDDVGRQKQLHSRGRPVLVNGKVALEWKPHTEYSPVQDPARHVHKKDLSYPAGQTGFCDFLDQDTEIGYTKVDAGWTPDAVLMTKNPGSQGGKA